MNHQCMLKLISKLISDEKQDVYITLPKYLSVTKGKMVILEWRNLANKTLNKWSKWTDNGTDRCMPPNMMD